MKNIFTFILSLLCFALITAQTTLNVYQNNGAIMSLPVATIDSQTFSLNPPPSTMNIFQLGGGIIVIPLNNIDSITYTVVTNNNGDILNPNLTYGSMLDQEGNEYATIIIGTQEWMAENLRTSIYVNGDTIPNVSVANDWHSLTSGAWVHYDNDSQYEIPYGKLYNTYVVSGNICPTGWRVPSVPDFDVLINFLGGRSVAGGKMKSTSTLYWDSTNIGTNESGFSLLPGGVRSGGSWGGGDDFSGLGISGTLMSSTFETGGNVLSPNFLSSSTSTSTSYDSSAKTGLSIRCIKN
jgi:uncharacterized protein (TIGR02145 family)